VQSHDENPHVFLLFGFRREQALCHRKEAAL
jgi:hypothetical protein